MSKIFVLEDDKDIREVVQMILELEGYKVVSFSNVHDFMNRKSGEVPDLFLLDVMLPDGSGIEVCGELKSQSDLSKAPIIIMSAHASLDEVTSLCKAEGFIQKPFDIDAFLGKVRMHIDHASDGSNG
ncbi:MAG: response regulator [Pedobacter sp.]|nr:MAG: response regulator [Pedobacter sp.]